MIPRIALVGDYSERVVAHRAIPVALDLAANGLRRKIEWEWIATDRITDAPKDLAGFSAIWVVPASPYRNMAGALSAIRFARETGRPFLGTCGGFQHALLEVARDLAGLEDADHLETNPTAATPVVSALTCSLVGTTGDLRIVAGSLLHAAYGNEIAQEEYNCSYGLNETYRMTLEAAGLRFTAFDATGAIRAAELGCGAHPFFVGTLFQPERAALRGSVPPLVRAFVGAC